MKLRLNANAIVTNDAGKILLIRLKSGPFAGGLSIPGGGINPGESAGEAAIREVREETGIQITSEPRLFGCCELFNQKHDSHRVVLLVESSSNGEPIETVEGMANWMDEKEAQGELIPFAQKAIEIWKNKTGYFSIRDD